MLLERCAARLHVERLHDARLSECGRENAADARFCSAAARDSAAERGTRGAQGRDRPLRRPRRLHRRAPSSSTPRTCAAILGRTTTRLRTELERHGGTVEKFIGDAVMALFGAPVAHEDDPERAVRAALAIRDWIARGGRARRCGSRSRPARRSSRSTRGPTSGEGMVAGDVVNTAARLQAAAPVNGILVDETTYRATRAVDRVPRGRRRSRRRARRSRCRVWEARRGPLALRRRRAQPDGRRSSGAGASSTCSRTRSPASARSARRSS